MANRYRNLIYSTAEYTHTYQGFRGIELNASSITNSTSRLSYAQNMYKDYDRDGADVIESIPGFRCFAHYGKKIHAVYYQRSPFGNEDHLLVHVGDKIMRHPVSDTHLKNAIGTEIATVNDGKSFGFEYGKYFYIMDTQKILQIGDDGSCLTIGNSGSYPYTPTTYVSGEAYEQRNLLTRNFKEEFYISDPTAYLHASEGLKFCVTDPNFRYCSVAGIDEMKSPEVYIPSYVNIAGVMHKVMSVERAAFKGNTSITAVYLPEGLTVIGAQAFEGCASLHTVVTPSTILRIEDYAFLGCSSLDTLYLGAALSYIGTDVFKNCNKLTLINYALGETELKKAEGYGSIIGRTLKYNSRYEEIKLALPFHDDVEGVKSVTVDGKDVPWRAVDDGTSLVYVTITLPNLADATGIEVVVSGSLVPLGDEWLKEMNALSPTTAYQAIINCQIAEVFDGRVFFSGNPAFPNTVFYTERPKKGYEDALYVGRYNYLSDGVGSYKVKAMLAVRDMLAIFKEGDDGSGSIFYHKKEASSLGALDTIYPVAYIHSGICTSGSCLSFLDDPVFLTNNGLMALNHENINYQRNIACRSHNVNHYLLREDLSKAHLCEWLGYLVVGIEGKIFLADSRAVFTHPSGSREYEWFLLIDIGAYTGDSRVYRYSPDSFADMIVHPTLVGEAVDPTSVYSVKYPDGQIYYYTRSGDTKYSLAPTEEFQGGEFFPATIFISHGKSLFFATDDGHLCVFNNDMYGVAPDSVKNASGYNEDEYIASMGNALHPLFYSFAGHSPKYVIKTALDDCGVPHLTKNTVKKSLVIKARSASSDTIKCEAKADEKDTVEVGRFPASGTGFDDFDFAIPPWYTSRYASTALSENEKRWIEKQIILTSEDFASPISIYSISYRYTIKGKIKNNA